MLSKLFKFLTKNLGLKLLAFLFALIMWLAVVNIDDPEIAKSFTTKVTFENEDYLTGEGKTYDVLDNSDTITFRVTGKRSYIERMSNSDFKAVADLESIEDESRVPVVITAQRNTSYVSIANVNYYVDVALEALMTEQFAINVETTGELEDGRAIGSVTTNPTKLKVSGPESVIETIDKVVVTVDVDGVTSDFKDNVVPVLLDADGNRVDLTELTTNASAGLVSVDMKIQDTKSVGFTFQTMGTPAEGYEYVTTTVTPSTVEVKGEASLLNTMNTITIPAEVIDLTDADGNIEKTIDITSYLPEDVTLVDSSQSKVDIVAQVEKRETENFEIPVDNITVKNLSSKYKAQFVDDTITLSVNALTSDLDVFDVSTVTGTIDATNLSEGENTVTVEFDLDDKYTQTKEVTIVVELLNAEE